MDLSQHLHEQAPWFKRRASDDFSRQVENELHCYLLLFAAFNFIFVAYK